MLGDYGVVWFEEGLVPDDVEGFKQLRAASPVLIARAKCSRDGKRFSLSLRRGPWT